MPTTVITSQGLDTVEVGAISGPLDVTTTVAEGRAHVRAAYHEAAESYEVVGSGAATALSPEEAHERVVAHLDRVPPRDGGGNVPNLSVVDLAL